MSVTMIALRSKTADRPLWTHHFGGGTIEQKMSLHGRCTSKAPFAVKFIVSSLLQCKFTGFDSWLLQKSQLFTVFCTVGKHKWRKIKSK